MWSLSNIATSIDQWLNETFNPTLALILEMLIAGIAVISLFAILGLVLVIMERKVSAWMQIRMGPNRVGPKGMFQSLADTLKLLVKEGMTPGGADKLLFNVDTYVKRESTFPSIHEEYELNFLYLFKNNCFIL